MRALIVAALLLAALTLGVWAALDGGVIDGRTVLAVLMIALAGVVQSGGKR